MTSRDTASSQLLRDINQHFIEIVGPIGEMLIDDVRIEWRRKKWQGPSALRHYINALAGNIDQAELRKRFLDQTGQLIYEARSSR